MDQSRAPTVTQPAIVIFPARDALWALNLPPLPTMMLKSLAAALCISPLLVSGVSIKVASPLGSQDVNDPSLLGYNLHDTPRRDTERICR